MKIFFDFDGTICNTEPILRSAIFGKYHYDLLPDHKSYKIQVPGVSDEEMGDFIRITLKRTSVDIQPYPDTIESLQRIYKNTSWSIAIVSARNPSLHKETDLWCQKHFDFPYSVDLIPEGKKKEFLNDHNASIWIDDHIGVLNDICSPEISGYLLDRRWNRYKKVSDYALRINKLSEFVKIMGF